MVAGRAFRSQVSQGSSAEKRAAADFAQARRSKWRPRLSCHGMGADQFSPPETSGARFSRRDVSMKQPRRNMKAGVEVHERSVANFSIVLAGVIKR